MRFALMVEPQQGITWPQQVAIAQRAEAAGFEVLYRSDHYESFPGPSGRLTSDAFATIAGLVMVTDRLRLGAMVSPVTFRHPGNVAKLVANIALMSGGRVELGLGAAWHEGEHQRFGFPFPDLPTRLEMLEEQLQVVAGLWDASPGWSFDGRHYRVPEPPSAPFPADVARPPLIVGTKGRPRAIRMAARHADHLNVYYQTVDETRRAFERLDEECRALGRDPGSVTRSVLLGTIVGADEAEWLRRRKAIVRTFEYEGSPEAWQRENEPVWISGTLDAAHSAIRSFADAGAELVIFQDFLPDDLALIDQLGELARSAT